MSLTWTQRKKAVRLWDEGWSMKAIMHELGVTWSEIKGEIHRHREMYPMRYGKGR
jgi:IS30 family transposase